MPRPYLLPSPRALADQMVVDQLSMDPLWRARLASWASPAYPARQGPPYREPITITAEPVGPPATWSLRGPPQATFPGIAGSATRAIDASVYTPTSQGAAFVDPRYSVTPQGMVSGAPGWPPQRTGPAIGPVERFSLAAGGPVRMPNELAPGVPLAPGIVPPDQAVVPRGTPAVEGPTAQPAQPAQAPVGQAQQAAASQAPLWGLLAAGLGILGNNYGNYGQAGPAIGRGGLGGLETFLGVRGQEQAEALRRQQMAQTQAYQAQQLGLQERGVRLSESKEAREIAKERQVQDLASSIAPSNPLEAQFAQVAPAEYIKAKMKPMGEKAPKVEWLSVGKNADGLDLEAPHIWDGRKFIPVPGFESRVRAGQKPLVAIGDIKTVEDFNQASAKKQAESLMETYNTLQTIPSQLDTMREAEQALGAAGGFVGAGAETKLEIAKFFNNNFGTDIRSEEVANAEVLRSSLFRQIMENLKKLDAQPSQQQQRVMQDALGNLGTDPKAIPKIINVTRQALLGRAKEHNRRVKQAIQNNAVFLYDITIPLPSETQTGLPSGAPSLPRPKTIDEAQKLVPGTRFIDPNGIERVR